MANRKSPSNAQSAPKDSRLTAFAARIEREAGGRRTGQRAVFATALNNRNNITCATLWLNFANQVTSSQHGQIPGCRVLAPAFDLPPLP